MQEPLVDVVDQEQVATKPCLIATFNLSSMTKEDASFTVRANALLQTSCKASPAAVRMPSAPGNVEVNGTKGVCCLHSF